MLYLILLIIMLIHVHVVKIKTVLQYHKINQVKLRKHNYHFEMSFEQNKYEFEIEDLV